MIVICNLNETGWRYKYSVFEYSKNTSIPSVWHLDLKILKRNHENLAHFILEKLTFK